MNEQIVEKAMNIILYAGDAKSTILETVNQLLEDGNIEKAKMSMKEAGKQLGEAHEIQTQLLFDEMQGVSSPNDIGILMVHAQDHFMNAISLRDMADVMIRMYEKLSK